MCCFKWLHSTDGGSGQRPGESNRMFHQHDESLESPVIGYFDDLTLRPSVIGDCTQAYCNTLETLRDCLDMILCSCSTLVSLTPGRPGHIVVTVTL